MYAEIIKTAQVISKRINWEMERENFEITDALLQLIDKFNNLISMIPKEEDLILTTRSIEEIYGISLPTALEILRSEGSEAYKGGFGRNAPWMIRQSAFEKQLIEHAAKYKYTA